MKYFRKDLIIPSTIFFIVTVASLYQTFSYVLKSQTGFVFPLVHNYEQDYYWYLSLMRQGWDGHMLLTSLYTPTVYTPQFVNTFFPLFGMAARILGLSLPVMYTMLRVAFGWGVLFLSYKLLLALKEPLACTTIGILLVIFGTPLWYPVGGIITLSGEFWTGFDPVFRITWLPHHLAASAVFLLILYLSGRFSVSYANRIFLGILSFVAVWFNPAMAIYIAGTFVIALIVTAIQHRQALKSKLRFDLIRTVVMVFVGAGIAGVLLLRVQNSVFPWTAFRDWERHVFYPVDSLIYLTVLGWPGILAVGGVVTAILRRSFYWNLIIGWYLTPFIGLSILSRILPLSNGRYLQGAGYIPAGILAAVFITSVSTFIANRFGIIRGRAGLLSVLITGAILIYSVPAFKSSIRRQDMYVAKNVSNPLVLVSRDTIRTLEWLSAQPGSGTVAVFPPVASMVPAISGKRVIAGHPTFTDDIPAKELILSDLYTARSLTSVRNALSAIPVRWVYIYQGNDDRLAGYLVELGYTHVFSSGTISILEKAASDVMEK